MIYITRGYEEKQTSNILKNYRTQNKIKFVQLRWSDIYKKLSELNSDKIKKDIFFNETMNFMESNRMDYVDPLNTEDYKVLKSYWKAKRKMKDILESVKNDFKNKIGEETLKDDYFSKKNRFIRYIDLEVSNTEIDVWCGYGFWIDNDSSEIELRVQLEIRNNDSKTTEIQKVKDFIKSEWQGTLNRFSNWKMEELDSYERFNIMKTEESLDEAMDFFQVAFKELSSTINGLRDVIKTFRKN